MLGDISYKIYSGRKEKGVESICKLCGKIFYARIYEVYKGHGKFCSVKCARNGVKSKQNLSKEGRKVLAELHTGANNKGWKGDKVCYSGIHLYVRRWKQKSESCEMCGAKTKLDLANISQEYKRDINDWEWLCRKCHMDKDGRGEKLRERNRRNRCPKIKCQNCKKIFRPVSNCVKNCSLSCGIKSSWITRRLKKDDGNL